MRTVEVSHVAKSFGDTHAVADVSFAVERGEIFGLLGPNGAGKTTTIRLLLDIFQPDRGTVSVLGGPMTEEKKDRIGYMPEERGLYQEMPLEAGLVYLGTLKGLSKTKVIGILGIAVTLLAGWALFLAAALWLGGSVLDVGWMQNLHPRWRDLGLLGIAAIPSLLFIAAFMALLSAVIVDSQEAQQIGPLMFVVLFLPIYVIVPIAQHPNGALAIGASLLPATAVSTFAIRSLFMEVPSTQFFASAAISLLSGVIVVWLAGRAFRLSMLRYGQRLRLSELFSQLRWRLS